MPNGSRTPRPHLTTEWPKPSHCARHHRTIWGGSRTRHSSVHGSPAARNRGGDDDRPERKNPGGASLRGLSESILAVTYSGMPERHTTIGAERFHFRVRNGIGWFPLAMAARNTV